MREEKRVRPDAEDLRVAAYYRWLSRGCPPGDDLNDWVAVEQEFLEEAKARGAHDI
jgi:hypothetical protein